MLFRCAAALVPLLLMGCPRPKAPPLAATPVAPPVVQAQGPLSPASLARFVVTGDTGKGNAGQYQVGAAMQRWCATHGCDFAVLLGDNIYEDGVQSVEDPQWQEKFERPYAGMQMPFYAVLGNHDYGGNGLGYQFDKGPLEVAYSARSTRWRMPATHYTFSAGPAGFVVLDTNSLMYGNTEHGDQAPWAGPALTGLHTPWTFVLGHHPYLSNGPHGNAGSYDGAFASLTDITSGMNVKTFLDAHVCGHADFYLSGHDHSQQWLKPACGAEMLVSGAGASPTTLPGSNPAFWQSATLGFLYLEVTFQSVHGQFVDVDGQVEFERTVTHAP